MFFRARSYWLAVGAVVYVALAALGESGPSPYPSPHGAIARRALPWAALFGLPAALAVLWIVTAKPARGEDRIDEGARSAARACFTGAAMLLAAQAGPSSPGFTALSNLGAAIASIAALVSLARIGSYGGIVEPPPTARNVDAAVFAALCWSVAVMLPGARSVASERTAALEPVVLDYATVAASVASLGLSIATAARVRHTRRLELGVADRATAALFLSATALAIGVLGALASVSTPDRLLPFTAVVASVAITASAVTREPTALARALRVTLALATLATPVALAAVVVTQASPHRAGTTVFAACALCSLAGLAAPAISRRFAPDGSRWLEALAAGSVAAMNPDPDAALEAALMALGAAGGPGATPPALFRVDPPEVVTVDRAGYAHIEKAVLPDNLVAFGDGEPERILRVEAARAVEVRKPMLRPVVEWLDQRGLAAVAVIRDELSAVGVLGIPLGARTAPTTLEEVQSLRALADRLGAIISVSASLSRSRDRELTARTAVETLAAEAKSLVSARDRAAGRLAAMARMLERPARVASYSPGARATVEQLERLGQGGRPITLLSAPGVDAVAWAALAHLSSARRLGPFTIVDGTNLAEHDLARYRDPEQSPIQEAAGGSLVLIDAHALPFDVQTFLGAALPDDVGIIASIPSTVDAMVASGKLSERLADRLGDRAVALPTLASRAEDLRALSIEHLGRIGVRLQNRPLGLAPRALSALLEYTWPGNDAELYATLLRAALVTKGEVIGVKELTMIGFNRGERGGADSSRNRGGDREG